jgi:hypothetical protein
VLSCTINLRLIPQEHTQAEAQKFRKRSQLVVSGSDSPKSDRINLFDVADNLFLLAAPNSATVT